MEDHPVEISTKGSLMVNAFDAVDAEGKVDSMTVAELRAAGVEVQIEVGVLID